MLTQDQIETMREIAGKASESPGYERVRLLPVWVWTSAWNGKAWVPVLTEAGREVLAQAEQVEALKKFAAQLVDARDAVAKEADAATALAAGLQNRLKLLDGPTDPTMAHDLADALAYAAEIDADPTPPTSSTHRWLVVLAKALRGTLKERNRLSLELDEAAKNWVSMEVEISKLRRENVKLKDGSP